MIYVAHSQIRSSVFTHGALFLPKDILWEIIAAHLHDLNHALGDLIAGPDGLDYPHDLSFLADALVEQRGQTEADQQGEQDADYTDTVRFFKKLILAFPP